MSSCIDSSGVSSFVYSKGAVHIPVWLAEPAYFLEGNCFHCRFVNSSSEGQDIGIDVVFTAKLQALEVLGVVVK